MGLASAARGVRRAMLAAGVVAASVVTAGVLAACADAPAPPVPTPTRVITTVAGNGSAGFAGDLQPARQSPLYSPAKVGFSGAGRPWIIDWNNHRVRELTADGALLTVVGTGVESLGLPNVLSIEFSVHHPFDLFLRDDGSVVFAGYHDPRIFSVTPSSHVRNLAGFGTVGNSGDERPAFEAAMYDPAGVVVAPDGTLYFSEEGNHQIRRVSADGRVHRVAGTGQPGYDGDGGPAIAAHLAGPTRLALDTQGRLWLCDTRNHVIRRIDADGLIHTVVGRGTAGYSGDGGPASAAELRSPYDLAQLPDGAWLIADSGNHVIRRVDADGLIHTVVGTSSAGFAGDDGPAQDARLDTPLGITVGPDGAWWIADTNNHRVRVVREELR